MQYRICQGVDGEKMKKAQKPHLKPSELFYKMLIDKVLSFSYFYLYPRRRTLLQGYHKADFLRSQPFSGRDLSADLYGASPT